MGMVQGIWTSVNNLFLVWKPGYKAWDHRFWKFVGLNTHIQGPGLKWSLKLVNGEDIPGWEWSYGEVTSGGACEGHRKPLILLGNWSVIRHESCALIDNGKFTRLYWESHWPKKNHTILRFSNISNEYIYIYPPCVNILAVKWAKHHILKTSPQSWSGSGELRAHHRGPGLKWSHRFFQSDIYLPVICYR